MAILVTNNAAGTLASGISDSDVTLTLTTGQGDKFPDIVGSDYYYLTIVDTGGTTREIVKCTAKTGDTFTIVRGADGPEDPIITTSYAFSTGDRVGLRFCKAMWDALPQLENDNTFTGDNTFDGDLDVTGAVALGSTLAVTGATTMAALTASGTATFNGNLKKGSNDVDNFPAGTVMLFVQTSAPTGWTKSSARNNYALRIVTGTASANDAGSSFTDIFKGRTIDRANLPNVTLSYSGTTNGEGAHNHTVTHRYDSYGLSGGGPHTGILCLTSNPFVSGTTTQPTTDTEPNHQHTYSGNTSSINGGVTQTEFDMDVNYVDAIIATKS